MSSEISFIQKLASWNNFLRSVVKSIIHQVLHTTDENTDNVKSPEVLIIYLLIPYYSDKGLSLLKSCLRKIRSNWVKALSIRFRTQYDVNKIEFYCNTKDKTAVLCNFFVVYDFSCPGCGTNYISKTERTLYERTIEHAWMIITVLFTNISTTAQVSNICLILRLSICHFLRHHHQFKTVTNLI